MKNEMKLEMSALSENESFARVAVSSFMARLNPTLEEVEDVKTAVSEAVTNCIIHGYGLETWSSKLDQDEEKVYIRCLIKERQLTIEVVDQGIGIENVPKAMEPLFTSKPELERAGMGFAFMEAFMDDVEVESEIGIGTKVVMKKKFGRTTWEENEE